MWKWLPDGLAITVNPGIGPVVAGATVTGYWTPNGGPYLTGSLVGGGGITLFGRPLSVELIYLADGVSSSNTLGWGGGFNANFIYSKTTVVGSDFSLLASQEGGGAWAWSYGYHKLYIRSHRWRRANSGCISHTNGDRSRRGVLGCCQSLFVDN